MQFAQSAKLKLSFKNETIIKCHFLHCPRVYQCLRSESTAPLLHAAARIVFMQCAIYLDDVLHGLEYRKHARTSAILKIKSGMCA